MNKNFSRIFAVIIALVMCMTLAVTAFADGEEDLDPNLDEVTETEPVQSIVITKNLIMKSGATVPAVDFQFTLASAEEYADVEGYENYAGITEGLETSYTASFKGEEEAKEGLPSDTDETTEGMKYVSTEFEIDFSKVEFPNPGVYHYVLTETETEAPYSIAEGSEATHYIDVYVAYDEDEENLIIYSVIAINNDNGKSDGFDNEYTTFNLTLKKTVSGNQASHTEYFEFEVEINAPVDGTYDVDITAANYNNDDTTNPNEIVVEEGSGNATFYLKADEYITIKDLPAGTTYTITEKSTGYKVTYVINDEGEPEEVEADDDGNYSIPEGTLESDTNVTVNNNRGGTIPTGVLLTIAPFAVLMVVGIAGVLFFMLKKKNSDAE